jgi:hypothetical protein
VESLLCFAIVELVQANVIQNGNVINAIGVVSELMDGAAALIELACLEIVPLIFVN